MTVKKWKHSGTKKHSMSDREIRNGLLSEKQQRRVLYC